jgi:alpha,alpha-trehalase
VYTHCWWSASSSVDYNGVVPEKFDVVKLSHLVDAEYGNQGLDFKLLNREGFAWTNCELAGLTKSTATSDRLSSPLL